MRLTKYEKETIILFNEEDELASIYTYMKLKRRLTKFSREHPEICRRKETNKQGGHTYLIDKSRMSIHLVAPYSKDRIEKTVEILNKNKKGSQVKR